MERRQFLAGMSGATAALAGCTGGSDDGRTDDGDDRDRESFPEAETILDRHYDALADLSFVATERTEESSSESDSAEVTEKSIRSGEAGTLVEETGSGSHAETKWFTDHARIDRTTHRYNPDGVTPPFVDRQIVTEIVEIAVLEWTDATGDDERVSVFESTGIDEETAAEADVEIRSVDVRIALVETEYIRSIDAEIDLSESADAERTTTVTYEYDVTDEGDASVSKPAFVDDAIRIEGELTEDNTAIALTHAGGPSVSTETDVVVQDAEFMTPPSSQRGPTFPSTFEPGDEAYVYWTGEGDAEISLGEPPSDVAHEFTHPSSKSERPIYLQGDDPSAHQTFEVRFDGAE